MSPTTRTSCCVGPDDETTGAIHGSRPSTSAAVIDSEFHSSVAPTVAMAEPEVPPSYSLPESCAAPSLDIPRQMGSYRILEKIGEGGMGVVYKAEQQGHIKRFVALKVVKPGMGSKEALTQFKAERQALAMMNHAHVAQAYDAGVTDDGRPYFVMEFVLGQPINRYCDRLGLSIPERLKLFVQACEAIQHAHQKAIVHRDIKPSNVLVCSDDGGRPLVKVIDFGVAKALSGRLCDGTSFTELGRLIGTPEYMSPEQAAMGPADVDTRSDIYSLGVLLYELISGFLPFDPKRLREATFDGMIGIIRKEEPPKPSTRLSGLGRHVAEVAKCRATEHESLCRMLKRELEWIPLKALRKDPEERYQSASAFADDVRNYLSGRPLVAAPQTWGYHARKFILKHRRAVGLAVAIVSILIALVVALAVLARAAGSAKWIAEVRLAQSFLSDGKSLTSLNKSAEAREQNLEAADIFRRLKLSEADVTPRLLAMSDFATPLMGSYGKRSGPGGFAGHTGTVNAVAVAPSGHIAVTASTDGSLKVWDWLTGLEIRELRSSKDSEGVAYVTFVPKSDRWIVAAHNDGYVRVWDVTTGGIVWEKKGSTDAAWMVACSPDGQWVLSSGENYPKPGEEIALPPIIDIRRLSDGELVGTLKGHSNAVAALAFLPDGRHVLSGDNGGTIKRWDFDKREQVGADWRCRDYEGNEVSIGKVNSIAVSPDGRTVVSGGFSDGIDATHQVKNTLVFWDAETGTPIGDPLSHDWIWRVQFSPEGDLVVSSGRDGFVRLWDAKTRRQIRQYTAGEGGAMGVAFLPDGNHVISTRCNNGQESWPKDRPSLALWDIRPDKAIQSNSESFDRATTAAVSDAHVIPLGGREGRLALWDGATCRKIREWSAHQGAVRAVALSRDGKIAVSAGDDGLLRRWDLQKGAVKQFPAGHTGPVTGVAFVQEDRFIISCGSDGALRRWDAADLRCIGTWTSDPSDQSGIVAMAVDGDGRTVIALDVKKTLSKWNLANEAAARESLKLDATTLAWSPVQKVLFAHPGHQESGTICRWNDENHSGKSALAAHHAEVTSIALSPVGATALSGDATGTVVLWDLNEDEPIKTFVGHSGGVVHIAFSQDGTCAVSVGADGTVRLWDFARARRHRTLEEAVRQARETLVRSPIDARAVATFVEWYVERGQDSLALELMERRPDAPIAPLTLARCHWRLGEPARARQEFKEAEKNAADAFYTQLYGQGLESQAFQWSITP